MKGKILLVDDDRVTLTMLEMILARHGHQVLSAEDGEKGFALACKVKPDMVISDMLLPKLHGLDLCNKIKQNPELKVTKVILMTAVYKGAAFQFEIRDCGADYFIKKPIDTNALLKKIDEMIAK
jgi:DNA-binding response OmpR family regulator